MASLTKPSGNVLQIISFEAGELRLNQPAGQGALTNPAPADEQEHGDADVLDPAMGRLSVESLERLNWLVGGNGRVEGTILYFIADRPGAETQLHPRPHVAKEIWKHPADFIRAAKQHCESGLNF